MSKLERAKEITEIKKSLNEEQKAIRAELESSKAERAKSRATLAEVRRQHLAMKGNLRKSLSLVSKTFSKGTVDECNDLAENILSQSSELAGLIRSFSEAKSDIEDF